MGNKGKSNNSVNNARTTRDITQDVMAICAAELDNPMFGSTVDSAVDDELAALFAEFDTEDETSLEKTGSNKSDHDATIEQAQKEPWGKNLIALKDGKPSPIVTRHNRRQIPPISEDSHVARVFTPPLPNDSGRAL